MKTYQDVIAAKYHDLIEVKRKKLCEGGCIWWGSWGRCENGILPVTSAGEDCPYFKKPVAP